MQSELNRANEEFQNLQNDEESVYEGDNESNNDYQPEESNFGDNMVPIEDLEMGDLPNHGNMTRLGRTVKKTGYLDYKPDFSNTKYESSNLTIGEEEANEIVLATVVEKLFYQYSFNKGLNVGIG